VVFWAMPPGTAKDSRKWALGQIADRNDATQWAAAGKEYSAAVLAHAQFVKDEKMRTVERISAPELLGRVFADPKWAAEGLIPEGLCLLAGPPKLGKSWLMLQLALSVASGCNAFDAFPCKRGACLYLALEDTLRRMQSRLRKIRARWPEMETEGLSIQTSSPQIGKGLEEDLRAWIAENPDARLIIIDTFAKVRSPRARNGNAYDEDYAVVSALKKIADEFSIAIIIVTHTRKMADEDQFATISGTMGLSGAADAMIVLRRERGRSDAVLHITGRDVEESEIAIDWNAEAARWTVCGDAEKFRMTKEAGEVFDVVDKSRCVVRLQDIYDELPHRKQNTVRYHLKKLVDDGRLVSPERGAYHTPDLDTSLTTPTTQTNKQHKQGKQTTVSEFVSGGLSGGKQT
ncbi:MAG: AAA family ATPase, partial [Planctomycetota bacterium]